MIEFNFIDGDLPETVRRSKRTAVLVEFVKELRANPCKWAEYPFVQKPVTMTAMASNIRRGDLRAPKPFSPGDFDARVHEGVLYVRFIGGLVGEDEA